MVAINCEKKMRGKKGWERRRGEKKKEEEEEESRQPEHAFKDNGRIC